MRFVNFDLISHEPAAVNFTSPAFDLNQILKMSAQVVVSSGTATGTVQLQVSNDEVPAYNLFSTATFTNWSNLGAAVNITTAGSTLVAQQDMCYRAMRAVFTSTNGAATATISVNLMCLGM